LQDECRDLVRCETDAQGYIAILEYALPRESRRPDVILLEGGTVVVLELKGKAEPSRADLDQVFAYARDLRCYHAACADHPVVPVLVPMRADSIAREMDGVRVTGPRGIHQLLLRIAREFTAPAITAPEFLRPDAYAPLPTLVRAARDLLLHEPLPTVKRAQAATDPAVDRITAIAHEAARTGTRRLVLLTGVPGSGKTLVGLRLVHAGFLDDLAVERDGGKPAAPAVFLSGNDPLVTVLQDALKGAGGGGKVFVRRVRDYVREYSRRHAALPPEHLLVFDEAQRAWDREHLARKHDIPPAEAKSEPEHFVAFAERIPKWCVVVGLIGTGQEIHAGEQGGVGQWRHAVEGASNPAAWTVHAPAGIEEAFVGSSVRTEWEPSLNLDTELRFKAARSLHQFVERLLSGEGIAETRGVGERVWDEGYRLRLTRDLESAKRHAKGACEGLPEARYGLLASSKAKQLDRFGVNAAFDRNNAWIGPWFNASPGDPGSCCQCTRAATEFQAQGLELDWAILAWGSDLLWDGRAWSAARSGRTRHVADILGLRKNVYRVLLTRGREGTVVFVPDDPLYDSTFLHLRELGARPVE
jgi:hypothetical protein